MTIMRLLVLIGLAVVALATWTNPTELFSIDGALIYCLGMYTDPITRTHHILYSSREWEKVHYIQVDFSHKILSEKVFQEPLMASASYGHIFGAEDGKSIHIAISAYRKNVSIPDVWYTGTKDGGSTWAELSRVPRTNMTDEASRGGAAMVVVRETGRVFIFYSSYSAEEQGTLKMVTKDKDSSIFSREAIIYKATKGIGRNTLAAQYSMINSVASLQLTWAEFGSPSPIMFMTSPNNGATWNKPSMVTTESTNPHLTMMSLAANSKVSPVLAGIYLKYPKTLRMFYTKDNGKSFGIVDAATKPIPFERDDYPLSAMTICGTPSKPIMATLTITGGKEVDDDLEYSIWSLNDMSVKRYTHPFKGADAYTGLTISCVTQANGQNLITATIPIINTKRIEKLLIASETI